MASIPAKVEERLKNGIIKFQKILKTAKDKDLNESDTVVIISDILAEMFGYDKYLEVTSELAIKQTFCDLAIKIENKFQFIIECKSIGTELKENHLKQAVDYGANKGIEWIILTNGINWALYKIKFEQPIANDFVYSFDFLTLNPKKDEDIENLFILCRESLSKDQRQSFYERGQILNKYTIGAFILQEPIISAIRKELAKYAEVRIENEAVEKIIADEVLRRELIEGENAEKYITPIKRYYTKLNKLLEKKKEVVKITEPAENNVPTESQEQDK